MLAVLSWLAFVVSIVAFIVFVILGLVKNRKINKKTWLWLVAVVVSMIIGATTAKTPENNQSEPKKSSSVKDATPTIMALSQSNIEKLSKLDGVKINVGDIKVKNLGERKNKTTGEVYHHVYYAIGNYRYNGRIYGYNMTFNFDSSDVKNAKYQVIQYGNDGTKLGTFETDLSAKVD